MSWWQEEPILTGYGPVLVAREDLVPGGAKMRFLPYIVQGAEELVFGGPFCGGAPYALSVWGKREGVRVSLFYAERRELHWRQRAAFANGATIYQVPAGRIAVVQKRARDYAASVGARFLPLGFDVPEATEPFVAFLRRASAHADFMLGAPVDEVWCATGSGMLARCLGLAFPRAAVHGVIVGLKSRSRAQSFPVNVHLHEAPYDFAEPCPSRAPFPCDLNYDAKAWAMMQDSPNAGARRLFWNVLGDRPQ